jgi:predicted PurR-regulated permease PerM
LFGILGLLLAVPGAAVVKVLGRRLHAWVVRDSR